MPTSSSLTIENLLSLLVCEWQLTRYSPMGTPLAGVRSLDGNETFISLSLSTMHDGGCPRNFGDFYNQAKLLEGMKTKGEAFDWYCRSRLHYSCSTVCVTFHEFIVPELQKRGILALYISTPLLDNNDKVCLKKIKVKGVNFIPHHGKVHVLRMSYFSLTEMKLPVEVGSHNTLQCSETGRIFDPTLGQLSGVMKPCAFLNSGQYKMDFKGEVTNLYDSHRNDMEAQKQRDIKEAINHRNPQVHPSRIAKRIIHSFLDSSDGGKSTYCANCLGVASVGSKLLRCGACKQEFYCSKTCQSMDWKSHKKVCNNCS